LFSDILVVPHALGQRVSFVEGEGPRLDPLNDPAALQTLRSAIDHAVLEPVYETITRVRKKRTKRKNAKKEKVSWPLAWAPQVFGTKHLAGCHGDSMCVTVA
jgi:hypothetical protein